MNIYVPMFMKIVLFQAYCKQNIPDSRVSAVIFREWQIGLWIFVSHHFFEKFERERFVNRKWKGQQNYCWKKHSEKNKRYG